jgi:hypothetical protein
LQQLTRSSLENGGSLVRSCGEKTQASRIALLIWYRPSVCTKNRRSRSGETSFSMLAGYVPARARVIAAALRSVANIWIGMVLSCSPRNSSRQMTSE